jgi:hypothetical protein
MTIGLRLARYLWVVAAATTIGMVLGSIGDVWTEGRTLGSAEFFNSEGQYRLSAGQASALRDIGLSPDWHAAFVSIRLVLVASTTVTVSTLLWRRARTWAPLFLAWFLLISLTLTALAGNSSEQLPGWFPEIAELVLFFGGLVSFMGLLLVFPDDGSARWIVAALIVLVAVLVSTGEWLWDNGWMVGVALLVIGLGLQVSRVARSRDRTARDLLLLTVTMITFFVALGITTDSKDLIGIGGSRSGLGSLAWRVGFETLFMAVPLTYGLIVLWILVRRGHWDMDMQLKGSVGYAGLTTLLVMGYFGVVAVVQAIVNDVSGTEGDTFALMVSTALIAAAILPLRSRLQRFVDRLFDRRRRDIDRLVETFETSVVRETYPDDVANSLLNAVEDVFRPEQADVWLLPEVPS